MADQDLPIKVWQGAVSWVMVGNGVRQIDKGSFDVQAFSLIAGQVHPSDLDGGSEKHHFTPLNLLADVQSPNVTGMWCRWTEGGKRVHAPFNGIQALGY